MSAEQVFHDQATHWMWDPASGVVSQSLLIPRGVALLAGGRPIARPGRAALEVTAAAGDADWGIIQAPFMRDHARTVSFRHRIVVEGATLT